jgi:Plasmid pRiA4b ORF-3-like protein
MMEMTAMEMTAETKTQRPKTQLGIYELRITLQEIRPPVWRLVQIPDTLRLSRLHDVLQAAIG